MLSPRKAAVVDLVPVVAWGAEIGTDHGQIASQCVMQNRCNHMIVSDISKESLQKAERLFADLALQDRATFVCADGLQALHGPVDAIVIAGMGAQRILAILDGGNPGDAALILQSNTDLPFLRRELSMRGYRIDDERLAKEGRRFYVAMRAVRGASAYSEIEYLLGPCLLKDRPPLFPAFAAFRLAYARRVGDAGAVQAIEAAVR